ncbi:antibiotic biosynthesis monooxygenase [Rhizobium wenxiniae]|uniref:putative quinol monooxygenase n=1 Tax=Rhizobium wenxiniae TaxID=1737357 RepID=UPI001C6DDC44|nr:antibiotic biosynthesis monooxygenase [Rhizobium wenxiniae]MBW9091532.1 antibiotic biosynthesis monooxygenase [Rhizobium wenxiniae]
MAELTNVAFFKAKPGRSKDLGEALLALVSPSRQEPGCLRYEIHQSTVTAEDWIGLRPQDRTAGYHPRYERPDRAHRRRSRITLNSLEALT